jgi:hypothetical protein
MAIDRPRNLKQLPGERKCDNRSGLEPRWTRRDSNRGGPGGTRTAVEPRLRHTNSLIMVQGCNLEFPWWVSVRLRCRRAGPARADVAAPLTGRASRSQMDEGRPQYRPVAVTSPDR